MAWVFEFKISGVLKNEPTQPASTTASVEPTPRTAKASDEGDLSKATLERISDQTRRRYAGRDGDG